MVIFDSDSFSSEPKYIIIQVSIESIKYINRVYIFVQWKQKKEKAFSIDHKL